MNFLNLLRVFTLLVSVFATRPLFATDHSFDDWESKSDLWQAFHLFETNDLKGAAAIINNYQAGCPAAYRYFEYLSKNGFIKQKPLPHDQIVNYSSMHLKYIDPIFNSSLVIFEIEKNSNKRNKLLGDGRLLAYNKARYLENNPTQKYGGPLNIYLGSVDPRSILAVCRLVPVEAKSLSFKGVSYYEIADYMHLMLQKHSKTADVLFECSLHFNKTNQDLSRYFLDRSAGYGHAGAQLISAQNSITPEIKAFFYSQAALNGHLRGMSGIARVLERGKGVEKDVVKAFAYYKQAVEHPDAEGGDFHNLAAAYENGIGIQANIEAAIDLYIQAIQKEYSTSTVHAARLLHRQGRYEEAFDFIEKAIEAKQFKDSEGIKHWLPKSYTETDLEKVINFWGTKAEQGNQMAREYLAELILLDVLGSKIISPEICCNWLEELVKGMNFPFKNKGELHLILGVHYKDTAQQFDVAFFHFTESAKLENKLAHLGLAQMYEDGLGISLDTKKAMNHYSESPECPNKWNNFGICFMKAEVIPALRPAYDKKARENFEKSIEFGAENNKHYIFSCYNLGLLYLKKRIGENETQQRAGVEKHLTKAANAGDKDAQRDLALYYVKNPNALNNLQYLFATTQSNHGEKLASPLKNKHELARQLLQQAANQNDGEAMRILAMLSLFQQKSLNLETMGSCIKLLQKAYEASDISEESQINIKNILCAFKVLASDGVIELKSDEITLVTEDEIQGLKQRLEKAPEYAVLLNDSQTEEDESDEEDTSFSYSDIEQIVETKEKKKEIMEAKETKELTKELKIDAPHDTRKKPNVTRKKEKNSNINNTITASSISSTANLSISWDSEQEPLSNKERKLREGSEKKNVKWRKVMKLMNLAIKVAGEGSIQPGKGSGTAIQVGERKTNVHKPHGRNSTNTEAGRMKSLGKVMNSNKSNK
ncbi:MAG: tetratricopeptide repeat protein [Candidatus Paracaedibacter sp.]